MWGYSFANSNVHNQLAEQQITFPAPAAFAHPVAGSEITPSMIGTVSTYAGQPLVTGQQAEVYANDFIAVHLNEIGGGQTYAQLSAKALALPKGSAAYTAAEAKAQTVFQGTTLRGLLLEAYAFGTFATIALIGAIAALRPGRRSWPSWWPSVSGTLGALLTTRNSPCTPKLSGCWRASEPTETAKVIERSPPGLQSWGRVESRLSPDPSQFLCGSADSVFQPGMTFGTIPPGPLAGAEATSAIFQIYVVGTCRRSHDPGYEKSHDHLEVSEETPRRIERVGKAGAQSRCVVGGRGSNSTWCAHITSIDAGVADGSSHLRGTGTSGQSIRPIWPDHVDWTLGRGARAAESDSLLMN